MKILRISLRNIASLEGDHTVDFTQEPLLSTGLFSISGPTGAGKSTLLDALCLALFNETPRLNAVKRSSKEIEEGDVLPGDPRNLLRRGSVEGWAEVAFVGIDGLTYTARWHVWRARNKAQGALQQVHMSLFQGNVGFGQSGVTVSSGKLLEVKAEILKKIGLSFDQFRRAILLAQGDFATFLKAEDRERAEILEALTGTERFAQLSRAVFEKERSERTAVAELEARLEGSKPFSEDERARAEEESKEATVRHQAVMAQYRTREEHARWFQELGKMREELEVAERQRDASRLAVAEAMPRRVELQHTERVLHEAAGLRSEEVRAATEVERGQRDLAHHQQLLLEAEAEAEKARQSHAEAERLLKQAQEAREASRPSLQQARALDAKLEPLGKQLRAAQQDAQAAAAAKDRAESDVKAAQQSEAEALKQRLAVERERSAVQMLEPYAGDVAAWLDRFAAEGARRSELVVAKNASVTAEASEKQKRARYEELRKREQPLIVASETARAVFEKASVEAGKWNPEEMAALRRKNDATLRSLQALQIRLRDVEALETQRASLEEESERLRAESEQGVLRLEALSEVELPAATQALETARTAWSLAEAAVSEMAVGLRTRLVSGEPCPVCGGREHPFAEGGHTLETAALRELKKLFQQKEQILSGLRVEQETLSRRGVELSKLIASNEKQRQGCESRRLEAVAVVPEESEALSIWQMIPDQRGRKLEQRLEALQDEREGLEREEQLRIEAEKKLDQARKSDASAVETLRAFRAQLDGAEREMEHASAQRTQASESVLRVEKAWAEARRIVEPVVGAVQLDGLDYERECERYREGFGRAARRFLELQEQERQILEGIGKITESLRLLERTFQETAAASERKAQDAKTAEQAFEAVQRERAAFFGGRSAEAVEAELDLAVAGLKKASAAAQELKNKGEIEVASRAQRVHAAGEVLNGARERRVACVAAMEGWVEKFTLAAGRPMDRPTLDQWLTRDQAWLQRERAALQQLEDAVTLADGAVHARRATLEQHEATRPTADDWETVSRLLTELKGEVTQAEGIANEKRAQILSDDQRRRDSAELMAAITERNRQADPWRRLSGLIGSKDGAAFRNIAQQWTLDLLLKYANAQLEQLATRYRLERVKRSLNLSVVDRHMADQVRSVHSLSGGESFLVSLGLALGLASLTSNRLRIESLFIDEGFGSLDANTLRVAMHALGHLEAQGRKVGIISHVSEMTEAIPVQIRVEKVRADTSRLVMPGATRVRG